MLTIIRGLFSICPGWALESVKARAEQEVSRSLARNEVRKELDYGWLYRLLLWGGNHPLKFSMLVGVACGAFSWAATIAVDKYASSLPAFQIAVDFSHATLVGTPWAIQATLLALAYPLVLTFIAMVAQRRPSSNVLVAVYLLDSGIVPAAGSAVALVAVMGLEYFLSPYAPKAWAFTASAFNGAWLSANLALTAYFLGRTIQFVQDETGRAAYVRLAVIWVLKNEFVASLKAHMLVSSSRTDQDQKSTSHLVATPQVLMLGGFERGQGNVVRRLSQTQVLHDVHLRPLRWVASRWMGRAAKQKATSARQRPTLSFPVAIGDPVFGSVDLCRVQDGPGLTWIEKCVVHVSFSFRRRAWSPLAQTSAEMLSEIAIEVDALAQAGQYAGSREAFKAMLRMHAKLLQSSTEEDKESSAASLTYSPYSFGAQSFHRRWLDAYRPVTIRAVNQLADDQTLFNSVARAASTLVRADVSVPASLAIESLDVSQHLAYALGEWWTRQVQSIPDDDKPPRELLNPVGQIYEDSIVSLVGALNDFTVDVLESPNDEAVWNSHRNRAQAYLAHIERCARLLFDAIERRDRVASEWFSDLLLKWWGSQQYELDIADLDYHPGFTHVRISLLELNWNQAQDDLHLRTGLSIGIGVATRAISLAVRRHWEATRTVVCALLIEECDVPCDPTGLALKVATSQLNRIPFHGGGEVVASELRDADEFLSHLLDLCFGDAATTARLDAFCERRARLTERHMVTGWGYGGSISRSNLESMLDALAQLLMSRSVSRAPAWLKSIGVINEWWRDTHKLLRVALFAKQFRKVVRSKSFRPRLLTVDYLRIDSPAFQRSTRQVLARALGTIGRHAEVERRLMLRSSDVAPDTVSSIAQQVARIAFGDPDGSERVYRFCRTELGANIGAKKRSFKVTGISKERLLKGNGEEALDVAGIGREIRRASIERAFQDLVRDDEPMQIDGQGDEFVQAVADACMALTRLGSQPVVLVATYEHFRSLQPSDWQVSTKVVLPGVTLERTQAPDEFGNLRINDAPVVRFGTPGGRCYVTSKSHLSSLRVQGSNINATIVGSVDVVGDDSVTACFTWAAGFGPPAAPTHVRANRS